VGLSEVGVDAVGVGGGELGEGLLPVVGDLSLDEAALGLSLVRGSAGLLGSLGGAMVLDVADRQPQQLDGRDWAAGCFSDTACLVFQAALVRSRNSCSISLGVRYPRAE